MFKRKKLNFFVAMIMVMTLMFGSTICFATENNNEILQIYGLFAEKGYTREDVDEIVDCQVKLECMKLFL